MKKKVSKSLVAQFANTEEGAKTKGIRIFCFVLYFAFSRKFLHKATRFDNTLSTRICGRIKCYREGESAIKTISPLQLAIQVVHKHLAGEQGTHCNGGSSLHLRGGGGWSQKNFFSALSLV